MVKSKANQWSATLNKIIDAKMLKKVKTKGEAVQLIKVHIQNSENILRNLIRQNAKKKFFTMIGDWLNILHNIPNEKLREVLYNIEAFRGDALNLGQPEPKAIQGKNTLGQKGISSSTKTSGNSNLVAPVQSSLTGKNPFAILKASAIASSQGAQFPNNFTNLPKVTPPFLPPLEGEAKNSTYTLVLDLDETLIHNVEVSPLSFTIYSMDLTATSQ